MSETVANTFVFEQLQISANSFAAINPVAKTEHLSEESRKAEEKRREERKKNYESEARDVEKLIDKLIKPN